ncbi:TetR/AcrR family transcriptional regulator [Streptomyces sp. NPDC057509]|uniref:TetR/AcrR family transcriptional regulator n=1 Tax=Streptomyces sp. NPDC057509 TaxID=3346152 RepID=UPI0036BA0C26
MAMSTAGTPARPMRADARRNYGRLLAEARSAFAEHGTDASLEDVARRAGVGIGTLYRHFPTRHALMSAVFEEAVTSLITRSRDLAEAERPCAALVEWLGAIVTHAGEYRGLAQALMSTCRDESSALARCNTPLREAGSALLARAQESGSVRADVSIDDLMQLTNAIALAAEQSPDDPELADRLLTLTLRGVQSTPSDKGRHPIPSPSEDRASPSGD